MADMHSSAYSVVVIAVFLWVPTRLHWARDQIFVELWEEVLTWSDTRTHFRMRSDRSCHYNKNRYPMFCQWFPSEKTHSIENPQMLPGQRVCNVQRLKVCIYCILSLSQSPHCLSCTTVWAICTLKSVKLSYISVYLPLKLLTGKINTNSSLYNRLYFHLIVITLLSVWLSAKICFLNGMRCYLSCLIDFYQPASATCRKPFMWVSGFMCAHVQ